MLNRDDIKAYLHVLGYGSPNYKIAGCLVRLEEQLIEEIKTKVDYRQYQATLHLLQYREKLNGYLPQDHPQLQAATKELATILSFYLDTIGWEDFQTDYGGWNMFDYEKYDDYERCDNDNYDRY